MAVRLVIGRAGAGKTTLCAREMRAEMTQNALGGALLWIVPEQATFTTERLLLTYPGAPKDRGETEEGKQQIENKQGPGWGMFRGQVLSFRRLAMLITRDTHPDEAMARGGLVDEVARLVLLEEMVRDKRSELTAFGGVADRPGFLRKLDETLREFRQHGHTGQTLRRFVEEGMGRGGAFTADAPMIRKLLDLAVLLDGWEAVMRGSGAWDAEMMMAQAAERMGESPLITGGGEGRAKVWVDGISAMSALEMRMLVSLALYARELTITLLADPDSEEMEQLRGAKAGAEQGREFSGLFARTERLHRRMIEAFARAGVRIGETIKLRDRRRFVNGDVARVEGEMFDEADKENLPPETPASQTLSLEGVEVWESSGPEVEVRAAAREIRRIVLDEGLRYREIGVIVPELSDYGDAIRRIFLEHGIAHFIDDRRSIAHHPLVEFVRSAAALARTGAPWDREDVLPLLKTGLTGVREEEAAEVENYLLEHGIERWKWNEPWRWIAPNEMAEEHGGHGQEGEMARAHERLNRVNAVRDRVWQMMAQFLSDAGAPSAETSASEASRGKNAAGFMKAMWELLGRLKIEESLKKWSDAALRRGEAELAQVHEQAWREIERLMGTSGVLPTILEGKKRSVEECERLLQTAMEQLSLGLIPPTVDQVLVSSVARSRVPEMEVVIILGAVEGQFPKVVPEDPILSDSQREAFNRWAADPIGEGSDRQLLEMPFFDYVALTRARRRLVVSYPVADRRGKAAGRSRYVARLREILGDRLVERRFDTGGGLEQAGTVEDLLAGVVTWARDVIRESAFGTKGELPADIKTQSEEKKEIRAEDLEAIYNWTMESPDENIARGREFVWQAVRGTGEPRLSGDLAAQFYPLGRELRMSVSQLEKFAACPLQYFMHYTLGLRPRSELEVDQLGMGLLQHRILERVYRKIIEKKLEWPQCDAATLRATLEGEVDAAVEELHRELAERTPGYEKLRARIKRVLGVMLEADRRRACAGGADGLRPMAVELVFGGRKILRDGAGRVVGLPVLRVEMEGSHNKRSLEVNGKIDRVDSSENAPPAMHNTAHGREVLASVIDYKSAARKNLELFRVFHGLSLQLPVYALVAQEFLNAEPVAAMYLHLGMIRRVLERGEEAAHADSDEFYQQFKPRGLADEAYAWALDESLKAEGGSGGKSAWFNLAFTKEGAIAKRSDLLSHEDFGIVLAYTRWKIAAMAEALAGGAIAPAPYRQHAEMPCDVCDFGSLCPFDRARGRYRDMGKMNKENALAAMRDKLSEKA